MGLVIQKPNLKEVQCPNCGGNAELTDRASVCRCTYCGTEFVIDWGDFPTDEIISRTAESIADRKHSILLILSLICTFLEIALMTVPLFPVAGLIFAIWSRALHKSKGATILIVVNSICLGIWILLIVLAAADLL